MNGLLNGFLNGSLNKLLNGFLHGLIDLYLNGLLRRFLYLNSYTIWLLINKQPIPWAFLYAEPADFHLSGEKPFVCPVCGMRFTRNFNMKEHLTKHGSSKPYQCRFCEENFQTRHIRRRHEQDVHRKIPLSVAVFRGKLKRFSIF